MKKITGMMVLVFLIILSSCAKENDVALKLKGKWSLSAPIIEDLAIDYTFSEITKNKGTIKTVNYILGTPKTTTGTFEVKNEGKLLSIVDGFLSSEHEIISVNSTEIKLKQLNTNSVYTFKKQ